MDLNKKFVGVVVVALLVSVLLVRGCAYYKHMQPGIDIKVALNREDVMPLVVLGSGPAGLSAAIYGVWNNIKTLVIHGPMPGGLLTQTTTVENFPGSNSILGSDIIANLQNHAQFLGDKFMKDKLSKVDFLADVVTKVDLAQWPFKLETERGFTIYALSIIIATGANPKMLDVPGEQEYWKRGVTTCAVCDGPFYKDQDVVVIGGGDSAVEEATQLARFAKNVTILVRKDVMRASPLMRDRLLEYPSVKVMFNVDIKKIVGNDGGVTGVQVYNNKTKQAIEVPAAGVFLAVGHSPNSDLFKDYLETDAQGYVVLKDCKRATSVAGVFAAGDVEDREYRQAGVALGHGIEAGLDAIRFLTSIGYNPTFAAQLEKNTFNVETTKLKVGDGIGMLKTVVDFKREVEQQAGLVMIKCAKQSCPPCAKMAPIYEDAAHKFADKMKFFELIYDDSQKLAEKLFVYQFPTFLIYRDGKLAGRYHGSMPQADFFAFIEKFIGNQEVVDIAPFDGDSGQA